MVMPWLWLGGPLQTNACNSIPLIAAWLQTRLWFASYTYRLINWLVKSRRFLIILVAAAGDSP
jgi:hypothetical protein